MRYTYREVRDKRQAEFNALPIYYAFSDRQLADVMKKMGLGSEDYGRLRRFQYGGFYLDTDEQKIVAFMRSPDPIAELMKDPEFAEDAFYEEMCNHEYGINWQGKWDVLSCFYDVRYDDEGECYVSVYFDQLGLPDEIRRAYLRASKKYYESAQF